MPNSADKPAEFDENGEGRDTNSALSDPDLDELGFAIPEFRVPTKAQGTRAEAEPAAAADHADDDEEDDDEFASEPTEHIPLDDLQDGLDEDFDRADQPSGFDRADQPSGFDRSELVKTVRMDAFDRNAVEAGFEPKIEVEGFLEDQRFAPDVLVLPPRVLTNKWQDGAGGGAKGSDDTFESDRAAVADTVQAPALSRAAMAVEEPELVGLGGTPSDDSTEAIDLDNELVEEVKPPPKPMLTNGAVPEQSRPRPNRQRVDTAPLPPQKPRSPKSEDDDLSGIVQELLDEKKAKPQAPRKQAPRRDDKRANWFLDVFSEEFFRTLPPELPRQTEREVRFIQKSLGLQKGARILDLACGFGRHSLELATRDFEVAGLDISMAMLQRALSEAQRRSLSIKFIHGDMRELSFNEIFDACICWQTSFGYFDDRTNVQVAQGIARAVKPGGRLLIDVINRDAIVADMPSRTWWEGRECVFLEEVEFDHNSSILHTKRSFIYEDGSPPREFSSYIRLYSLHELRQLLHFAGFRVTEVSGEIHHRGSYLGPVSSRLILLAEKVPPKE